MVVGTLGCQRLCLGSARGAASSHQCWQRLFPFYGEEEKGPAQGCPVVRCWLAKPELCVQLWVPSLQ